VPHIVEISSVDLWVKHAEGWAGTTSRLCVNSMHFVRRKHKTFLILCSCVLLFRNLWTTPATFSVAFWVCRQDGFIFRLLL